MEGTVILSIIVSAISVFVAISSWLRSVKNDTTDIEHRLTTSENKLEALSSILNGIDLFEMVRMQQSVSELSKRVEKLDTDVEKKIDQLSEKLDGLVNKMNEILLRFANK